MRKRILSFVMLFAITFCFISGCKKDDNAEQEILIADGKEVVASIDEVNYTADQLYSDMIDLNSNAEYLYEELEDLLIKTVVPVTDSMKNRISNEIEKWKKEVKENATINGTAYKEALKTALEEEGVSSEDELFDKRIFELQEEIATNQYWSNYEENYYNEFLKNRDVYHISQILVSVSTNGNKDYFDVEPSEATAEKIYKVASELMNGESFHIVAQKYSDDTTSKPLGGDMGIVTLNDTSIPDEIKYALASYSVYFENADIQYPEYLDSVYGAGVEAIPQEYIELLGEVYDEQSTVYHITTTSGTVSLYSRVQGRAILFNNLFNSRTFRFLQSNNAIDNVDEYDVKMPLVDEYGFEDASKQNIVVNDEGYPIIVVRSDKGIHFISINKSAYAGEEELKKYYSKEIDRTDDYVTYLEGAFSDSDESTRLEKLNGFANEYATMKVSGNSSFTGNDAFIRYDMFESYLNGSRFVIKNEKIKNIVLNYIRGQKEYVQLKIDNVFDSGYEKLSLSEEKYANSSVVTKEIPILKCLDNKGCTYTYENGFKAYTSGGGSGETN